MHIPYGSPENPCQHKHKTSTKGSWQNWEVVDGQLTGRYDYIEICLLCGALNWSELVEDTYDNIPPPITVTGNLAIMPSWRGL